MFKDMIFPLSISEGAAFGPRFQTDIVIEGGGGEVRNDVWEASLAEADVAKACKDDDDRQDLIAFFMNAKGQGYSWKFWDRSDHSVETGEGLLRVVTAGSTYQLYKRYTRDTKTQDEDIYLPKSGTVTVKQGSTTLTEGSHYTINYKTGLLTLIGSPLAAPSSWIGDFYKMCRFGTDRIAFVAESIDVFRTQNIPIMQTRFEEEAS